MRNQGHMERCRCKQLPQNISPNRVWKVISTHRPMFWPQVIRKSSLRSIWLSTVVTFQGQLLQLCSPFATFSDMVQISHDACEGTRATLNTGERDPNHNLTSFDMTSQFLNSHKALNHHSTQIDLRILLGPLQHFPWAQPFLVPGPKAVLSTTKHRMQCFVNI